MPIEHRKGDLFLSTDLDAISHACNTLGVFGKGIALAFKAKFPLMYSQYNLVCRNNSDKDLLGTVFVWQTESDLVVYNLFTQGSANHWIQLATLDMIRSSVEKMIEHAIQNGIKRIGMPKIGAGLGGLDWQDVEKIITELSDNKPVTLVVHTL